jgi:hypothetical protein
VAVEKKVSNTNIALDGDRWALWEADKNTFLLEINSLKDKVGMIGYFEGEIDNLKREFSSLKGEFALANNKSVKSVKSFKRESILSMKKQSEKSVNVNIE